MMTFPTMPLSLHRLWLEELARVYLRTSMLNWRRTSTTPCVVEARLDGDFTGSVIQVQHACFFNEALALSACMGRDSFW